MKKNRAVAWFVLLLFVVFLVLSLALLTNHAHHDCTGPHCEICACLSAAGSRLRALAGVSIVALAILAAVFTAMGLLARSAAMFKAATPIALKVKLLD